MILWNSVNLSKYFTVLQESGKRDGLHLTSIKYWSEALSGPEFTNQYFIYYVRKLPVWVP